MKKYFLAVMSYAALLIVSTGSATAAADPVKQHNSSAVWFENWIGLSNATLTVTSPDGQVTTVFAERGTPVFELERGTALDGIYRFELNAATEEQVKPVNQVDNGRGDAQRDTQAVPFYSSGSFVVERGAIIAPQNIQEGDG